MLTQARQTQSGFMAYRNHSDFMQGVVQSRVDERLLQAEPSLQARLQWTLHLLL